MSPTGGSAHPPSTHRESGAAPVLPLTKEIVGLIHWNAFPSAKQVKHKLYPSHWQINERDHLGPQDQLFLSLVFRLCLHGGEGTVAGFFPAPAHPAGPHEQMALAPPGTRCMALSRS